MPIREVAADGFPAPEGSARPLLGEAVAALSSSDPVLRDDIAYALIERYVGLGAVPVEDAAWVLDAVCSDETLHNGIGVAGDDSVFGRSFAVLALGICVYRDNTEPYLEHGRWQEVVDAAERYAAAERDLRGYVDGKGWAHSVAHTADLLGRLAQNRYADEQTGQAILRAVSSFQRNAAVSLGWGEDERLARAIALAVERGVIGTEQLAEWAAAEVEATPALDYDAFDPGVFARRDNLRRLLRAIFFRLGEEEPVRLRLAESQAALLDF